jgi:chromosome segregation ATPase
VSDESTPIRESVDDVIIRVLHATDASYDAQLSQLQAQLAEVQQRSADLAAEALRQQAESAHTIAQWRARAATLEQLLSRRDTELDVILTALLALHGACDHLHDQILPLPGAEVWARAMSQVDELLHVISGQQPR